jgi:hypothetical protein
MSRSAADATRFTATGPYASSKPGGTPYKLPSFMAESKKNTAQGPGGRPETPKEKVERLRAQARAARLAQSTSRADQLIDVGRRFANKAHKVMVYSLITASGRCFKPRKAATLQAQDCLLLVKVTVLSECANMVCL